MSAHGMRHQIDEVDEVDWLPTVITPTNHTRFVVDCREEDSTTDYPAQAGTYGPTHWQQENSAFPSFCQG